MGGTVKCSGAAKIKPPFEMGVDNLDVFLETLSVLYLKGHFAILLKVLCIREILWL